MSTAAAQSSTQACPVERLGREWAALAAEIERIDETIRPLTPFNRLIPENRRGVLQARQMSIQEEASWLTATSAAGAQFQLMLAFVAVNVADVEGALMAQGQTTRLMFGVRGWLSPNSGVAEAAIGGGALMPADMDPRREIDLAQFAEAR